MKKSDMTDIHKKVLRTIQSAADGAITRSKLSGRMNAYGCNGEEREHLIAELFKADYIYLSLQYGNRPGKKVGLISLTQRGINALSEKKAPAEASA